MCNGPIFYLLLHASFASFPLLSLPFCYSLSSSSTSTVLSLINGEVGAPVSLEGDSMGIAHSVSVCAIFGVFLLPLRGCPLTRYESEEVEIRVGEQRNHSDDRSNWKPRVR